MAQPKSTGRSSSRTSQSSGAQKPPARKTPAKAKATAKAKAPAKAAAKPKTPAKAKATAKAPTRRTPARRSTDDALGVTLAALRDRLARGIVITGERLQETVDDAVRRGRITSGDAEDLVQRLLATGRKQTEDLMGDLEGLLGRGPSELVAGAKRRARTQARRTAAPPDRVLREVDRARRAVGLGPSFPILGYDELVAAQIAARLSDLNAAQLRKVRDYERKHANRKSVLEAIEKALR